MSHQNNKTSDLLVKYQQVTLLELLDRLLDKGVVVKGEILLSVADIDLIYLNLGLLLSSVKTVQQAAKRDGSSNAPLISWQTSVPDELAKADHLDKESLTPAPRVEVNGRRNSATPELLASALPTDIHDSLNQLFEPRATIDPAQVEKGLAKLVLTLVDLIRKLMEKQAIRRMDEGELHASEIERLGNTFYLLDEKMEQLKKVFDLEDDDLNLDLGPLGELL